MRRKSLSERCLEKTFLQIQSPRLPLQYAQYGRQHAWVASVSTRLKCVMADQTAKIPQMRCAAVSNGCHLLDLCGNVVTSASCCYLLIWLVILLWKSSVGVFNYVCVVVGASCHAVCRLLDYLSYGVWGVTIMIMLIAINWRADCLISAVYSALSAFGIVYFLQSSYSRSEWVWAQWVPVQQPQVCAQDMALWLWQWLWGSVWWAKLCPKSSW